MQETTDDTTVQSGQPKPSVVTEIAPFDCDIQSTCISPKPPSHAEPNAISYRPTSEVEVESMLPVIQLSSIQTPQHPISVLSFSSPQILTSNLTYSSPAIESIVVDGSISDHESNMPQSLPCQAVPSPQSLLELTETSHPQVVLPSSHPLSLQSSTANVTSQTPTIDSNSLQPPFIDNLLPRPPQLVVVNPTPNPTPHPTPPTTPLIIGVSVSNSQQLLTLPHLGGVSASRRERSISLEETPSILLPLSAIGTLDCDKNTILSGSEMVQPIVVPSPPNVPNVSSPACSGVNCLSSTESVGQSCSPLPMAREECREQDTLAQYETNGSSISSFTSDLSQLTSGTCASTSSRTTGGTTLSAFSSDMGGEEEKINTLTNIDLGPKQLLRNVPICNQDSTMHPTTMLADLRRKERITSEACDAFKDGNAEKVATYGEVIREEEYLAFTSDLKSLISAKKDVKRNVVTVPLTSSPAFSPIPMSPSSAQVSNDSPAKSTFHQTLVQSPERSTSPDNCGSNQATVTDTRGGKMSCATSSDRNSSRSTESRSQEHSIVGLSGLSRLGGLGMTIAAAYPPPTMVRKQVTVGAGRGRAKVVLGRAVGGKARAIVRRNSAGPGVEMGGKEVKHTNEKDRTKAEMEKAIQGDYQEASRLESSGHQFPADHPLTLIKEEKALVPSADHPSLQEESVIKRPQVIGGDTGTNVNRPPRFNIGSNSDEGSGAGSKSVGSGSSMSVGHSIDQRVRLIMENDIVLGPKATEVPVDDKKLGALLLYEKERQQRKDEIKEHKFQRLGSQRQQDHKFADVRDSSKAHEPSRSLSKQEIRHSERVSEKAKEKVKAVDPNPTLSASKSSSKSRSKSTPNLGALDPVLAAKLKDSLAEPLLPKGRPVVVDTESEYDTESDDGSWSSEEMSDVAEVSNPFIRFTPYNLIRLDAETGAG